MPNATMTINLGKDPDAHVRVIGGRASGKRSSRTVTRKGMQVRVRIEAKDPRALFASMQGVMKQFMILDGIDALAEGKKEKRTAKV